MDSIIPGRTNQDYQERNIAIGQPNPYPDIHVGYGYALDRGPVGPTGAAGPGGIWSIRRAKDTTQIGKTNMEPNKDNSIHVGWNLTKNTDINIGDMITIDRDTNTLKLRGNVKTKSMDINGLRLQNVECDICASDEEISKRVRMCIIRQKIRDGDGVTQEEKESLESHNPRVSPGLYFQTDDDSYRSICADCIFESAFDFAHKMRFVEYTEAENTKMKEEIKDLKDAVSSLSQAVKILMRTV
jgi:hypothetical protein